MKYLILFAFAFTYSLLIAQVETSSKALLELEQNIYEKSFSKKWKKSKQTEWEKKCQEAKSQKEINGLFNEFSDLLAQSVSFSMGNSDAKDEYEFAEYLLKVEGTLTEDLTKNWNSEARGKWKTTLSEYVDKIAAKRKEEDLMRKFHVVTGIVKSFEKNFPTVWDDSKKNAFKTVVSGEGILSVDFKGAKQSVVEDTYGVKSVRLLFDAEEDEQLAKKVMSELEVIILDKAGAGYKKTNEMDPAFENNNKFVYQFEGEKFAETAKRPTVTIGITQNSVYVEIIEPVFGH